MVLAARNAWLAAVPPRTHAVPRIAFVRPLWLIDVEKNKLLAAAIKRLVFETGAVELLVSSMIVAVLMLGKVFHSLNYISPQQ